MLKKFVTVFLAFTIVSLSFAGNTYAQENADEPVIDDFVEVDEKTLFNESEQSYYVFKNDEELKEFIYSINEQNGISTYACLPRDPGYPGCIGDPVVKTTTKTISSKNIGYRTTKNYMKNDWFKGPGTTTLSISRNYVLTFGISFNNVSGSFSFSTSITKEFKYSVKKGYEGNFKHEAQMMITRKQNTYKHASGKTTTQTYDIVSMVNGTGRFFGVSRKAG